MNEVENAVERPMKKDWRTNIISIVAIISVFGIVEVKF